MAKVNTTISLDADVKAAAQALLADFGLDLSTAVNLFLRQTIYQQAIPFEIRRDLPNAETRRAIDEARQGIGLSRSFSSVAELMEELNAED